MERDEIKEELEMIKGMLRILIRSKLSNKLAKVQEEVERRGRMRTVEVMDFVNVKRPTALGYMKELGKQLGFVYRKGDSAKKISGIIAYDKSKVMQDHLARLEKLFGVGTEVSFHQIMTEFGLSVAEARDFAYYACESTKKYVVKDENKLERL